MICCISSSTKGACSQGESEFPRGMVAILGSKIIQAGLAGVRFFQSIGPKDMNRKQEELRKEAGWAKICLEYLKI